MILPREDVHCPACPNPETVFQIEDVGMKFDQGGFQDGTMTLKATRPVWEPVMLEHLRSEPDEKHRRLYDLCVTELMAAGQTVEENVRATAQAAVDSVRRSFSRNLRPGDILCCDSHNPHCEPPTELCCDQCTEASHDTFPIRHADGSTCVMENR